jgi:hypothetical protein
LQSANFVLDYGEMSDTAFYVIGGAALAMWVVAIMAQVFMLASS